jgi:hypothetical protein
MSRIARGIHITRMPANIRLHIRREYRLLRSRVLTDLRVSDAEPGKPTTGSAAEQNG